MGNVQPTAISDKIPTVLSIPQCAAAYNLPPYALRRWIKEGKIKTVLSGRKMFINTNLLNDFLAGGGIVEPVNGGIRIITEQGR